MGNCCNKDHLVVFERQQPLDLRKAAIMSYIPRSFQLTVKRAVFLIELELDRPVYIVEIYRMWKRITYSPIKVHFLPPMVLIDLYRNDEVLADPTFNRFSMRKEQ